MPVRLPMLCSPPACVQGQTFQSSLGKTLQDEVYNLFPPNSIGGWPCRAWARQARPGQACSMAL
jgi:hypothetical protein